jgi:hypothetical protein
VEGKFVARGRLPMILQQENMGPKAHATLNRHATPEAVV